MACREQYYVVVQTDGTCEQVAVTAHVLAVRPCSSPRCRELGVEEPAQPRRRPQRRHLPDS
jgi:hypothetical protein